SASPGGLGAHVPYTVVFMVEIAFLILACLVLLPALGRRADRDRAASYDLARSGGSDLLTNPAEAS
ncbi:MAG: hypothetical protein AAFR93_16035, partial [Pseudomonadota bacterium]